MSTWVELLWNDLAKLCSWKLWNSLTSCWINFFSEDFSYGPKPKEIYTWFFCRLPSKYSVNIFRLFFFPLWSLWGPREAVGGVFFKLWKYVGHRLSSVNIAGKMVLPLCHLPWWNGSFIRGKWLRKSALSQPPCSQVLIVYETGERSTKS